MAAKNYPKVPGLTLMAFRTWVERQGSRPLRRRAAQCCPIASFLRDRDPDAPELIFVGLNTVVYGEEDYSLPTWATRFITAWDGGYPEDRSPANEALKLL